MVMEEHEELDIPAGYDQEIQLSIAAKSEETIYLSMRHDRNFVQIHVNFERNGARTGKHIGSLSWSEEWHKTEGDKWRRAIVFVNSTDEAASFSATFRPTE